MSDKIEIYILRFSDLTGHLKELDVSSEVYNAGKKAGIFFDGSSIQGFARIYESDMRLIPDENTMVVTGGKAYVFCDTLKSGKPFEGDPRFVLKRIMKKAQEMGLTMMTGVEPEFHLLDENLGLVDYGSYFDASPKDKSKVLKEKIIQALERSNIKWETHHHEVEASHHEITFKYDNALRTAENLLTHKQIVKVLADEAGIRATFMPKPMADKDGNGLHTHISLFKNEKNIFYDSNGKFKLSQTALYFIGGLLKHAKAISAVVSPIVNSYKRLGICEAPNKIYWASKSRDALVRVPEFTEPNSARIEYRSPDPSCNPYLAFAVLLAAGLDGIKNKISPPKPIEIISPTDVIEYLPKTLNNALTELEKDDVIKACLGETYSTYLDLKRKDWELFNKNVTNWEIEQYIDV